MIDILYKPFQKWSEKGTIWIYSDTHFGDEDLAAGVRNRPNAEQQLAMINAKVGRADTFILLGDVGDLAYAKRIRAGRKVLILGNHDAGATNYSEIFDEVYAGALTIAPKLILSHEPLPDSACFALGVHNFHGHRHNNSISDNLYHTNCCSDVINYTPINFNQWLKKSGVVGKIKSIHRVCVDNANKRVAKRGYSLKKGKEKNV